MSSARSQANDPFEAAVQRARPHLEDGPEMLESLF